MTNVKCALRSECECKVCAPAQDDGEQACFAQDDEQHVSAVECATELMTCEDAVMRDYECYVYIVASRSRTLYIGMTSRLQARIADHQNGVFEGFSKDYRCTRLVYFERCTGPTGAILREKQLKGWTRAKKIALIERANPTWVDLSEAWRKPVERYRWSREELAALEAGRCSEEKAGPSTPLRSAQDDE